MTRHRLGGVTQAPAVQLSPGRQATQAEPLTPHAVTDVLEAGVQVFPLQQPWQVLALHCEPPTQLPPTQVAPFWQNEHAFPLSPHCAAVWFEKGMQVLLVQQPAQDMLSHAAVLEQLPFTHA